MKRVLVIERDEQVRLYVSDVLSEAGYTVATARSAADGRRLLAGQQPDLVVSSFSMPEAERQQLVNATLGSAGSGAVPLLFTTTERDALLIRRWTKAGASGFLSKPFMPEELLREVRRLMA